MIVKNTEWDNRGCNGDKWGNVRYMWHMENDASLNRLTYRDIKTISFHELMKYKYNSQYDEMIMRGYNLTKRVIKTKTNWKYKYDPTKQKNLKIRKNAEISDFEKHIDNRGYLTLQKRSKRQPRQWSDSSHSEHFFKNNIHLQ